MLTYWVAAVFTSIKECISSTGEGIAFPLVGQNPEHNILRCQMCTPKSNSRKVWGTSKSIVNSQIYLLLVHIDSCIQSDVKGAAWQDMPREKQSIKHEWTYVGSCITWFAFLHLLFTCIENWSTNSCSSAYIKVSFSISKLHPQRVRGNRVE